MVNLDELDLGQLLGVAVSRKVPEALATLAQLARRFRLPAPVLAILPDLASVRAEEEECGRRGIGVTFGKPYTASGAAVANGFDFLFVGTDISGTYKSSPQRAVLRRVTAERNVVNVYAIDPDRQTALALGDESGQAWFQRGARALSNGFVGFTAADVAGTPLERVVAFRQSANGAMLTTTGIPTRWDPFDANADAAGPTDPTNVFAPAGTSGYSALVAAGICNDPGGSTYPEWRGRLEVPPGWGFLIVTILANASASIVADVDIIPDDDTSYP